MDKLGKKFSEAIARAGIIQAHSLVDYYPSLIQKGFQDFWDKNEPEFTEFFGTLIEPLTKMKGLPDDFKKAVESLTKPTRPISSILVALSAPQLIAGLLTFILFPAIRYAVNAMNYAFPTAIAPFDIFLEAWKRGIIDDEVADYWLRSFGWNEPSRNLAKQIQENLLSVTTLTEAFNRGIIGWDKNNLPRGDIITRLVITPGEENFTYVDMLRKLGYHDKAIQLLGALRYVTPTPSDIVSFAVREVFSPAIAQKFGQFEDFPEEAVPWAEASGISRTLLQMYWAAHWRLPSATQGFEMLHRGIITQDELKLLLKALDVMPFWRDKLIQLSYNPLTRVDIRRMHKLGVIRTDAELIKAYKDIGYNEENARRLALFTKVLTAKEQQDLVRREIKEMFSLGMMGEAQAIQALVQAGVPPAIAELEIKTISFRLSKQAKSAVAKIILSNFTRGTITRAEAQNLLAQNQLDIKTFSKQLDVIDFARQHYKAEPTRTDLRRYFLAGIIDEATYTQELVKIGVKGNFLKWELELAKKTLEASKKTKKKSKKEETGTA